MEDKQDPDALYEKLSSTIQFQVSKLEMVDEKMKEHVHSVPKIAKKIAEKMNLEEKAVEFCVKCAYLHDIGKLFIPLEILEKKDKLNFFEKRKLREHTTKGYELCMSTGSLTPYANAAKSHHENEKGNGYPDRLRKGEIPLEAEIIKVADIYDGICLRRETKQDISRREVLEMMRKEVTKGTLNKQVYHALLLTIEDELRQDMIEEEQKQNIQKVESIKNEIIEIMRLSN